MRGWQRLCALSLVASRGSLTSGMMRYLAERNHRGSEGGRREGTVSARARRGEERVREVQCVEVRHGTFYQARRHDSDRRTGMLQ